MVDIENSSPCGGNQDDDMDYDYRRAPRWYSAVLLGIQHFLGMCTPNAIGTLILVDHLCLQNRASIKSELIGASFVVMGISTFLQTILGCRLPIFQGASFVFIIPFITMMNMPDIQPCNISDNRFIQDNFQNSTMPESVFHMKIRLINGALIVSSLVEIILSISGVLRFLTKIISPLSLASMYTVLCMSISESLIGMMAEQWAIGITALVITILLSVVLAPKPVPIPRWWIGTGWKVKRIKIFQISPIISALLVMWFICWILTITGAFSKEPKNWGYLARTDIKLNAISDSLTFKVPYLIPWGLPIMMPSIIVGVAIGVLLSVIESVGDYIITAQVCKAPEIPQFAINRGILIEGIGVLLSGLLGSTVAPTSYTGNIGILKMTKAGNIIIAQVAAILMILCGIFPVVGAIFVTIPIPVVGGVIFAVCMMIMSCAISNLQFVNLHSTRNALVFGISITMGIYLPQWSAKNQKSFATGYKDIDDIIQMLLSISLFINFVISTLLDNILPGHYFVENPISVLPDGPLPPKIVKYTYLERCTAYDPTFLKWIATRLPCLQYLPLFPPYRRLEMKESTEIKNFELISKC